MTNPDFIGTVIKKRFGKGSKSEYEAICLQTEKDQYILRRQGGNPFHDEVLHNLVGKEIRCRGSVADYTLVISDWIVLDDRNRDKRK